MPTAPKHWEVGVQIQCESLLWPPLSDMYNSREYYDAWHKGQKELIDGFQESIRSLNAESFKNFVNPHQFKALIDTIVGFNADADRLLLNQASQLVELYSVSCQQYTKPWVEAAKTGLEAFPRFAEGHPESFIKIFNSMFDAFDNSFGRIFHVPPVGKDREKIELLLRCLDDLTVFAANKIEFQQVMHITGLAAMEKFVERLAEKISSGQAIEKFDEFFDIWKDVSEQAYSRLIQTGEFSTLQERLLNAGLNARTHSFKVMEMYLSDFPIVLRPEMDDMKKTVCGLEKKLKGLEKQLQDSTVWRRIDGSSSAHHEDCNQTEMLPFAR